MGRMSSAYPVTGFCVNRDRSVASEIKIVPARPQPESQRGTSRVWKNAT
jgi:hypothetical protein